MIETLNPELAERVPREWDTRVVDLRPDGRAARLLRAADALARFWLVLAVVSAGWHVLWIASSSEHRKSLTWAGMTSFLAGLVILVVVSVGRVTASRSLDAGTAAAVRATYDEFVGGATSVAYAIVVGAVVVFAASASGQSGSALIGMGRRLVGILRMPESSTGQVLVAVGAAGAGMTLVAVAPAIGVAVTRFFGVALAYLGVRVAARSLPESRQARDLEPKARPRFMFGVCTVAVLAVPSVVWATSARSTAAGDRELHCNGYADLCDRPLDQVVFAGTHNAMASPEAGFLLASQTGTIGAQLRGGIRALLLDTTYGIETSTGVVWTDTTTPDVRSQLTDRLDPDTLASAEYLRTTLLPPTRDPDVYLCHASCEIGATLAVDAFRDIRLFLEQNPSEVVIVVIQDSTVAADTMRAIRRAGLDEFAYSHLLGEPWPTLAQLVRQATPLIVMSERHGEAESWFLPAFEVLSDTPYDTRSTGDLGCEPNRGDPDNDLLLLNAWVNEALPSRATARIVNSARTLSSYADQCREERGRIANVIAVNFWREGDLINVVASLNGLKDP